MTYIKGRRNPRVFYVPDSIGESMVATGHVERATRDEYLEQRNAAEVPVEAPAEEEPADDVQEPDEAAHEPHEPQETPDDGKPAGNASTDAWRDYALAQGYSEEQLEDLGRDEIKSLIG